MRSMTGCGRGTAEAGGWTVTVELKSVNHRFLDVALRLPRELSFAEETLRKAIGAELKRGHVDVYLTVTPPEGSAAQVTVNEALAARYAAAAARVADLSACEQGVTALELLRMEGVVQVAQTVMDEELLLPLCGAAVKEALARLGEMRRREGENLRADLKLHLDRAAAIRQEILLRAPLVVEEYRARLTERLARLPIEPVDPARLAQEVALLADRCAIDEELSRLESHIGQMNGYLNASGEVGKKMDFLIQEMNREANTIGSKASDARIAQHVVDLKSEIEKLREQIQNVE